MAQEIKMISKKLSEINVNIYYSISFSFFHSVVLEAIELSNMLPPSRPNIFATRTTFI